MRIIALNGFKQSGKGTTAHLAQRQYEDALLGAVVRQVGFADKLKVYASRTLGYRGTEAELIALMDEFKLTGRLSSFTSMDEPTRARLGHLQASSRTGRQFLQDVGNEAREVFGSDFWVDQVLPPASVAFDRDSRWASNTLSLGERYPDTDLLLITDLRYPNEAERVLGLDGEVWEVIRPGLESDGHASETPLPRSLVTRQIDNSGSITDLAWEVDKALAVR